MSATLRCTWPIPTPGSIGRGGPSATSLMLATRRCRLLPVELLVDKAVRLRVLVPAHVADRPLLEALERQQHLTVKLAQGLVLDLVVASDLAHDQLRIADQLEPLRPEGGGAF